MKIIKALFVLLSLLMFLPSMLIAGEKIQVVASTLDMADFAREIGGDRVEVYAISRGQYDLHFFEPKPSQLSKLRKADVLITGGLGVDAWITPLIDASRNPKINVNGEGFVDPSAGVAAKDIPQGRITGEMGDVHPYGNPHFWFTPDNVAIACDNIATGLSRIAPSEKEYFQSRKNDYIDRMRAAFNRLKEKLIPYRGTKVIQFHESWNYFCGYFGLDIAGSIEPKPGIPPSAAHLQHLVGIIRNEGVRIAIVEPYYPEKPLRLLKEETGITVVRLPLYLGGSEKAELYLDNLELIVSEIVRVLGERNE
jgi:zinc/manganese transport system substrate-binding protein